MTRPRASRHFRTERIAPGVHAALAAPDGFALCNSGIVDLGGATVVFDSMLTPMAGVDLLRTAERLTGRAPAFVVNSHYHGDHQWGNCAFEGAHIVSTHRTREVVLERSRDGFLEWRRELPRELAALGTPGSPYAAEDVRELRGWFRGVLATPRSLRIVPADVTFSDELVLRGSRRALHLISYGGGHSPSDVFGYLPDERILFAGDLALEGYHLSVGDGQPAAWGRMLDRMRTLRVDRVVPGHGRLGDAGTLVRSREYLGTLERIAARAHRDGTSLRALRRTPVPERYRALRFSFMFPESLVRTYRLARARGGGGPSAAGAF